jgi:hypothetical protein
MTIDERLEKLTERHEALAQTAELLVAENRQIAQQNRQIAEENRQRDRRMGDIMVSIGSLARIAEIHEQRIERLEE